MPSNPVTVAIAQGSFEADLIKARLESAGIPVALRYESFGRIAALTIDGVGQVEIQVPPDFEEDALEVLASPAAWPEDLEELAEQDPPPDDL